MTPAVHRIEDEPLLRGAGRFTASHAVGALVGRFVRSTMAHARILSIETGAARAVPGVVAVYVMADLESVLPLVPAPLDTIRNRDGSITPVPPRQALARDRVRFAGEAVAIVVARSETSALDGAEAVFVDYAELPALPDLDTPPGPVPLHNMAPGDVGFDWAGGDQDAADRAIAAAPYTINARIRVPRILGLPMEPAGALANYDGARWTLIAPSQGAHAIQRELAQGYLGVELGRLRVVTPDVGGAFGLRIHALPEHAVLLGAAALLGRPIAWQADRSESNVCEPHARDLAVDATLALDADGRFLGLRAAADANLGAYVHPGARATPTNSLLFGLQGAYRLPAVALSVRGRYTNTTPTGPFRGAGQPEGTYVLERLIDLAARRCGIDAMELRRRNVLRDRDFPYRTPSAHMVDSGDPASLLQQATAWIGTVPAPAPGLRRGSGMALYMKVNGMGRQEKAEVASTAAGVVVRIGSQCNGQGHATTMAALVAGRLGLDPAEVRVVQGDTDAVGFGTGTGASSALGTTGSGLSRSCADLLRRARIAAADQLGAEADSLEYAAGSFRVPGANTFTTLGQLARDADLVGRSEVGVSLTYTFGCHACVVGVDPATGSVVVTAYAAFDELGPLLQTAIAHGQIHGGVAQGVGQALLEAMRYDGAGQPITASLMDYGLPRAADLPRLHCSVAETPSDATDLRIRGAGEAGAMASMAAVVNAVAAVLGGDGAIDAPLSPHRVWQAMRRTPNDWEKHHGS